jgi:hypothetical protein
LQTSEHRFGDGWWKVSRQLCPYRSNHNWSLGDQLAQDGLGVAKSKPFGGEQHGIRVFALSRSNRQLIKSDQSALAALLVNRHLNLSQVTTRWRHLLIGNIPPATRRILDGLRHATGPPGADDVRYDRRA